jgi:hypothetical protein
MHAGTTRWAREEFGATRLGDIRNTRRLVAMATGAARCPSGKVSAVFDRAADREGAYDFLENEKVDADAVIEAMGRASARRAAGSAFAFVAIDSSSLSVTDNGGAKGFGRVAPLNLTVRGLMVMNAYAVSREGVPLGLVDQRYWNRGPTEKLTPAQRTKRDQHRRFDDKESAYFLRAATLAHERLAAEGVQSWVVIDRGGDSRDVLLGLHQLGCHFTVRASWNRDLYGAEEGSLQATLDGAESLGKYNIEIGRSGRRAARTALVEVRAAQVTLHFRRRPLQDEEALRLFAVRIREIGPHADKVEWTLYTNVPVLSAEHAQKILESYRTRWRVEEFHRTWKQGECNIEDAQLGSVDALKKWAMVLAAVAARIERLKYLGRQQPKAPASIELTAPEIEALTLDRLDRARKARAYARSRPANKRPKVERVPETPTIGVAVAWLAELGGWIGPRNGPPGSTTLARGLDRLSLLVEGIALARSRPDLFLKRRT